jgi:hypothetical protein
MKELLKIIKHHYFAKRYIYFQEVYIKVLVDSLSTSVNEAFYLRDSWPMEVALEVENCFGYTEMFVVG